MLSCPSPFCCPLPWWNMEYGSQSSAYLLHSFLYPPVAGETGPHISLLPQRQHPAEWPGVRTAEAWLRHLAYHVTWSVRCWHNDNVQVTVGMGSSFITWYIMRHVQCTADTVTTYEWSPGMSCYMYSALLTQWQHTGCYLACHVTCTVHCWHSDNIRVVTWHVILYVQCTVDTIMYRSLWLWVVASSPGMSCYKFSAPLTQWQHTSRHLACHVTCPLHCWHRDYIWVITWHIMLHVLCTADTVTTYESSPGISCCMFRALLTQWQHTSSYGIPSTIKLVRE